MKIDVYKRMDGSIWADYASAVVRREHRPIKSYEATTRHEMESLVKSPGDMVPARVRALAERALAEYMERNQQPEPEVFLTPALVQVKDRNFWGRLRWLLKGK